MPGAITFGGIGSGIDVEGMISGLVGVERSRLQPAQQKAGEARSAISALGDLGSLLSKLKTTASKLGDERQVASFKASSSGSQVVATTTGVAAPGSYQLEVTSLASEQRTYSNSFASKTAALGANGSISIQVGSGDPAHIAVSASDSLDSIATKINAAGLRVSASTFYDGSEHRLVVRGLDAGQENAITFTDDVGLGLATPANTKQVASDAVVKIDGYTVTSKSNQIQGAISGVSLALTGTTTEPLTLKVESDPAATAQKMQDFVDAYNAIVDKVQALAGFGTTKAQSPALAADASLRGILSRLSSVAVSSGGGGASVDRLADVGVAVDRRGRLTFDQTKFAAALAEKPQDTAQFLAGGADGVMKKFGEVVNQLTDPKQGLLTARKEGLETRARNIDLQIEREQARITRYAETLRKQFTQMDTSVAQSRSQLSFLA